MNTNTYIHKGKHWKVNQKLKSYPRWERIEWGRNRNLFRLFLNKPGSIIFTLKLCKYFINSKNKTIKNTKLISKNRKQDEINKLNCLPS